MIYDGGKFDVQNSLQYLPGLPWAKYKGEKHFNLPFMKKPYEWLGPQTAVDIRLDENDNPRPQDIPINKVDHLAMYHDIAYRDAESLEDKHKADRIMLEGLKQVNPSSIHERIAKFVSIKALQKKLALGVSFEKKRIFNQETATQISDEIYAPYRELIKRKVYSPNKNHIYSIDFMEFPSEAGFKYLLTCIDIFSKKLWGFAFKNKNSDNTILALNKLFKQEYLPKFIWSDDDKAFFSHKMKSFLKDHDVQIYHTHSDKKAVVIQRANRTIREMLEKIKTEYEYQGLKFRWIDHIYQVIDEYNNSYHSTVKMIPNEAHLDSNHVKVRETFYEKMHKKVFIPRFSIGNHVRIYKWKKYFAKHSGKRY